MARYRQLFTLLLSLPALAWAQDNITGRSETAQELADCAAYYLLVSELPGMQPDIAGAPIGEPAGQRAMQIATQYGNARLLQVRLHLALEHMSLDLQQNWLAIVNIRDRFANRCPALLNAPENQFAYQSAER